MKVTIKAKDGYRVRKCSQSQWAVLDGEKLTMICNRVSMDAYQEVMKSTSGDGFEFCECFETVKGNKFIYFRDNDFDVDYIVKFEGAN